MKIYSPSITGSTGISGSLTVTGGVTASLEGTASYALQALSASYAPTAAAFPFTGSARITGSLIVTGSYSRLSGSFSGSLIDNITDVYTSTEKVEHVVSLTQAQFNTISGSADPNTLYYITDALSFATSASYALTASFYSLAAVTQNAVFSGSVRGEVRPLSISSNTASLDCALDNFFDLTIVSGSNTFIEPTNIRPGQTINLRINQPNPGNGTVSFPSSVKQVSGSAYVPTTGSGATDIVTLISFDTASLYLSNIKKFV